MIDTTLRDELIQASPEEASRLLNNVLRGCVRSAFFDALGAEVEELCGAKYAPNDSPFRRAGSEEGTVWLNGEKQSVRRPRVRHEHEGEVSLEVYRAAGQRSLFDDVVRHLEQGLSQRGAARASRGSLSKSAASRMWEAKSREQLAHFRERDLGGFDFVALMIDGVRLANEVWVMVAQGITVEGDKMMLDFEEGSSESAAAVGDLIARLKKRGVDEPAGRRLLVVRDGSAAIASAVSRHWPLAVQQECLVHMQRHTRDKLRKRDKADFDRHCGTLRKAQGRQAGEEAFDGLIEFLSGRNAAAALALRERRDALLGFHRLDASATLNVTFLNTNSIENSLRNWREATGNVKRWKEGGDMVSRWMATGMLWAEAGFRRIRHAEDLGELASALAPASSTPARSLRSQASVPDAGASAEDRSGDNTVDKL